VTIILAIESSCDETGVGICQLAADGGVTLLADEVASSVHEHARFGGVVPEIASRAHLEALGPTMRRALAAAGVTKPDVVAATIGPGLAGALLVGVAAAKAYSAAWQVPFYAVNHLGGHLAADVYEHGPLPESVGLLVSGGHTNLLHVRSLGEPIEELGSTVDDGSQGCHRRRDRDLLSNRDRAGEELHTGATTVEDPDGLGRHRAPA